VQIKAGNTTFAAHSSILRTFSSCARVMPEPFTEWDLHLLTIFDGHPPAADVVAAWLEALYWYQGARHAPSALQEALPVLRFADAIGSPAGFMNALVDRIEYNWSLFVATPSSTVTLPLVPAGPLYVTVQQHPWPVGYSVCRALAGRHALNPLQTCSSSWVK
jgi:hypothetical protein